MQHSKSSSSPVNLALQGGGSHGAFTWGVLDALLEHGDLAVEGISGSSAGAVNAVLMADGWLRGGPDGAREQLASFWGELGRRSSRGLGFAFGEAALQWVAPAGKMLASMLSPAQINPLDLNPLRDLLAQRIDFERLRSESPFKLFVAATEVRTGRLRLFRSNEMSVDAVLASACLPRLHHPVEIDGELYWDGGFSANPAVFPLFYECEAKDVLLVLLSPLSHADQPRSAEQIQARMAELSFSANFQREMQTFVRAAEFITAHAPGARSYGVLERRLADLHFHMIDISEVDSLQRTDTKLLTQASFLDELHQQGRKQALRWLEEHGPQVGRASTLDLQHWAMS